MSIIRKFFQNAEIRKHKKANPLRYVKWKGIIDFDEEPVGLSIPAKANSAIGRFREIVADPLNILIRRVEKAGTVQNGLVTLHNGNTVPLDCYYGDFSEILIINSGVHEPLEEYVFQEVLEKLDISKKLTMLELGAYWAHYSMWLKSRQLGARTICVEPDESNFKVGKRNFEINGFEGEFICDFVASDRFGVDSYLHQNNLEHLDILHSDIQGYEVEMLANANESLERNLIDYLFISTHSQVLHQSVIDILKSKNYRVEVSSDFNNETTSFDGFVFASSKRLAPVFIKNKFLGRSELYKCGPEQKLAYLTKVSG